MRVLHIDFETSSKLNIGDVGVYRYCEDLSTELICVAWAFDDEPVQVSDWLPVDVQDHIMDGGLVYAHNAAMEERVLYHFFGIDKVNIRCTSAAACYHALPSSLEAVAEFLGLEFKKDKEGSKILRKHFKTPVSKIPAEDLEVIKAYCKMDVEVERAVHKMLGDLPSKELEIWKLDQLMNSRGITVDEPLARRVMGIVESAKGDLNKILMDLTDGLVERPTMGARIIKWLSSKGIETNTLNKEFVEKMLAKDLDDDVREVLLCRQRGGGSSTGKFKTALDMIQADGRIRGNLKYHGATTGRWSGSGFQPQNLPRGNVADTDTLAEEFLRGDVNAIRRRAGNVFDGAKSAVRPLLKASEGKRLYVVDYSSIEARVLAWYAGQDDLVDAFRNGTDIYCLFASKVFDRVITKSDKRERMVGKGAVLGLGYGMGANKFKDTLSGQGMEVSLDFAQGVVDTYREAYPSIRQLWYDLDNGAVQAVQSGESKDGKWFTEGHTLVYTLPSGRYLRYQNCGLFSNRFDRPAVQYDRPLGKNLIRSDSYGGKWCENVCQAIARDVMADSMLDLHANGYKILLTVHDEIIIEDNSQNPDFTLNSIEGIMSKERNWCSGLPLAVEGFHSVRFKK